MADKVKAQGILAKIKALFDGIIPPAAPAPPAAPPAGATVATPCSYNVDGSVPVFVDISDDNIPDIDINDKVFTDAPLTIPYTDGTYNVTGTQFGFTVAGGIVTAVNDLAGTGPGTPVVAAAPPAAPPVPPPPATPVTQAQMESMAAKFGTGTSEDRLSNIETMLKSLMEYNFGYQIQQASQQEAIVAYRDSIATLQASAQKITDQELKINQHGEMIGQVLELSEALVAEPTTTPVTLNGNKKEKFDRMQKKDEKFQGIVAGLKQAAKDKKY